MYDTESVGRVLKGKGSSHKVKGNVSLGSFCPISWHCMGPSYILLAHTTFLIEVGYKSHFVKHIGTGVLSTLATVQGALKNIKFPKLVNSF